MMKVKLFGNTLTIFFLCSALALSAAWAAGPPPATVRLGAVVEEEVRQTRPVTGVLYYDRTSEISTELAGLVDQVEVEEGNGVEVGSVLVRLDTDILDKEISYQQSRIEQVELGIQNARKQFERLQRLFDKSGVSEKEYDDALFNYRSAQLEKQALNDTLQKLLVQKKRSVITAPFAGVILEKHTDSGSWVQPGSSLLTIGSREDLFVRVPIGEKTLRFIERGQTVDLVITAFDRSLTGSIVDLDPVADLKTKNVFLKISIPAQPLIAENMSATVFVPVSEPQRLRIFSRAALIKFQGEDFVYTVKEGKASIVPVTIVTFLGDRVGVNNPAILPGMKLVVEGNERLRPDQPVSVVGAE